MENFLLGTIAGCLLTTLVSNYRTARALHQVIGSVQKAIGSTHAKVVDMRDPIKDIDLGNE